MVPFRIAATRTFNGLEVQIAGDVLRALEHHVLEEMREARASSHLIRGTDVIPEVHGHERQPVILGQDHVQPVAQRELVELQARNVRRSARLRTRRRRLGTGNRDENGRDGKKSFHEHAIFLLFDGYATWPTPTE